MKETSMKLTVMSTLAVKVALEAQILPEFAKKYGVTPDVSWNPTTVLMTRIENQEKADAVILIDKPMAKLVEQGNVIASSVQKVARAGIGIAVKNGAISPDISTPDAFKAAMLAARSVAYSRGGASGIYFAEAIKKLGIADEINAKATIIPEGFTAEQIMNGNADIAIQQISELMTVNGVTIVGPLPEAIQLWTDFSAGIFADAKQPENAQKFIDHLTSEYAHNAYMAGGLTSRLDF